MDMTIKEFFDKHGDCATGHGSDWDFITYCKTMHDVWNAANADKLIWLATRPGVLTNKENRLFACWCVHRVWHRLTDERSRTAVEVAEQYAQGLATEEELDAARAAAHAAMIMLDECKSNDCISASWGAQGAFSVCHPLATFGASHAAKIGWIILGGQGDQAEYLRKNHTPNFAGNYR